MGFFTGSKIISVSSTVYNLAGDPKKRPSFLKTTVLGAVLSHSTDRTVGQQLNDAYISGPGIKLRGFARWCRNHGYDTLIGLGASSFSTMGPVDATVLAPLLPAPSGSDTITVVMTQISLAQYTYWVDQWMLANYPAQIDTDWTCDFDEATNTITVTLADLSVHTFTPTDYVQNAQYLYATYYYTTPAVPPTPYDPGPPVVPYDPGSPEVKHPLQYFIYRKGSGTPALDALFTEVDAGKYFLPYIPILVNQHLVWTDFMPDVYAANKKAVHKALGPSVNYNKLIKKIFSNPAVGRDVHYIYITFGVSANVLENACRRYIYEFFLDVMGDTNTVIVTSNGSWIMNYWMQILWAGLTETSGTGRMTNDLGNPAKKGEVWWQVVYNERASTDSWIDAATGTLSFDHKHTAVWLWWQVDLNNWRRLEILDLVHINMIYGGKAVVTGICDALSDDNESPFIIPMNEAIYKSMSLMPDTQMSTACAFLVFNCYTVKRAPWYTAGFFKVILIVVGIAISIFTGGAGAVGLLGTNLAVGTMLGLEGTAAVIAGAIANALAAMIVIQIIQFGADKLFGPKLGALIGGIVGIFALGIGTGLAGGMDFSQIFEQLTSPVNLLKITEAAGNAYAQIMQGEAQSIVKQTQNMLDHYKALTNDIEKKTEELLGVGGADLTINPLAFTEVDLPNQKKNILFAETPDSFLSRTLLSGSEISDLSRAFVNSFCDATLTTKLSPLGGG